MAAPYPPPASEALYFDKAPVLHIVQWEERNRLARIDARNRDALRTLERRAFRGRFS